MLPHTSKAQRQRALRNAMEGFKRGGEEGGGISGMRTELTLRKQLTLPTCNTMREKFAASKTPHLPYLWRGERKREGMKKKKLSPRSSSSSFPLPPVKKYLPLINLSERKKEDFFCTTSSSLFFSCLSRATICSTSIFSTFPYQIVAAPPSYSSSSSSSSQYVAL